MTFADMKQAWKPCSTRGQQRALCEQLAGPSRGWFQACREAVEAEEEAELRRWLENPDKEQQALLNALGPMATLHLRCAQVALRAKRLAEAATDSERQRQAEALLQAAWEAVQCRDGTPLCSVPDYERTAGDLLNAHWPSGCVPQPAALADAAFCLLISPASQPHPLTTHQSPLTSHSPALARDLTAELLGQPPRLADRMVKVPLPW